MNVRNDGQRRTVVNRGVAAKFREHLERSPGTVFYLKDLVDALEATEVGIQQAASRAVRDSDAYKVHINARAWVYAPKGVTSGAKRVFEELAVAKDGTILIQDEHGSIYRATEL